MFFSVKVSDKVAFSDTYYLPWPADDFSRNVKVKRRQNTSLIQCIRKFL